MDNANYPHDRTVHTNREHSAGQSGGNRFMDLLKRPVVIVSLVLLLLLLGLYLYKESQLNDVRQRAAQERAAVVDSANKQIAANNRYLLKTVTKPFSWALRSALLTGNTEQVDQYLFQFVQEDKFSLVVVADENGKIISSTDQNYTGASFADHFKADYLKADAALVDDANQEKVVVVSPIMGLNSKMGTLLAVYQPDKPIGQEQRKEE